MTVFFTADTHFGHNKILQYCKRPFADADEMNRVLIERWNAVVRPSDTVWVLGDFCFAGHENIFHQLHGTKHLIIGNHDTLEIFALPWASQGHYQALNGQFEPLRLGKRPKLVLSHYGMRSWHAMQKGCIMLFGHSHSRLPGYRLTPEDGQAWRGGGTLDVGVDCWNFYPVTLEQIKTRLLALPEYMPEVPKQA